MTHSVLIEVLLLLNPGLRLRLGWILVVLLVAFCLRVLGQFLVMFFHVQFLPRAEEWFSGLMPYPQLLASQISIIVLYTKICVDVFRGYGYFATSTGRGVDLLIFGSLYLGLMILRYIIRMTLYPNERWASGCIPIFFHWVLSSFLLVLGVYYFQADTLEVATTSSTKGFHVAAIACGLVCVTAWAIYQVAPSMLAALIGLGASAFAVRPQKKVNVLSPDSPGHLVDLYRPQHTVSTPTLVLEVVPASLRDSLLAGLTAKMWAERGYTVILRKETPPQQNEELDQIGSWVGSQSWFDGSIVNWNAGSVGRLMEQLRAHDFPNGFRVLLAAAK